MAKTLLSMSGADLTPNRVSAQLLRDVALRHVVLRGPLPALVHALDDVAVLTDVPASKVARHVPFFTTTFPFK